MLNASPTLFDIGSMIGTYVGCLKGSSTLA
jgi:hypothetical protein